MSLKLITSNEKGETYQADGFKLLYRRAGSISGDNDVNPDENLYLTTGTASVTIESDEQTYNAPAQFGIPSKTSHKITAQTDIVLVMFDE